MATNLKPCEECPGCGQPSPNAQPCRACLYDRLQPNGAPARPGITGLPLRALEMAEGLGELERSIRCAD